MTFQIKLASRSGGEYAAIQAPAKGRLCEKAAMSTEAVP